MLTIGRLSDSSLITDEQSKRSISILLLWRQLMRTLREKIEELNSIGPPLKAEVNWPTIPLVIYCVNCEKVHRVTEHGACSVCGSDSVVYRNK